MTPEEIVRRFEALKGKRGNWESHWQEIADYVAPSRGDFSRKDLSKGNERRQRQYDSTAEDANERLAQNLQTLQTDPSAPWFLLRIEDDAVNDLRPVQLWLQGVQTSMLRVFNSAKSGFHTAAHEMYVGLSAFGTGVMFVPSSLQFQALHLGQCYAAESSTGLIDTLYREFEFTARQALQFFPKDRLDDEIISSAETQPMRTFAFLHAVFPRGDIKGDPRLKGNKPWLSSYISLTSKTLVLEGGYDEFPYLVPRWSKRPGEVYGRSPAMKGLADIRLLNTVSRDSLSALQKAIEPPLLMPNDGFLSSVRPVRTHPGAINYYDALNDRGPDAIKPLTTGVRPDIALEWIRDLQAKVEKHFVSADQELKDRTGISPTEILDRRDERFRTLGSFVLRQQVEFLDQAITRVFMVMSRKSLAFWARGQDGPLPLPPRELFQFRGQIVPDYVSPIVQAQKSRALSGIEAVLNTEERLRVSDPAMPTVINGEALVREVASVTSVPQRLLRSSEEIQADRIQRAEQQAQEQALSQTESIASSAKDLATV